MSFLMVNQGEGLLAEMMVNKTAPQTLVLGMYKNNKTLADGDTEADYTEADFIGYSPILTTPANWTATPGAPTLLQYPEQLFQSTQDQTAQPIYGYYLMQQSSGKLMCVWRFDDGPYIVSKNGDKIYITPKINFRKVGE